jgi:polyhydroxyalkanoate synthesis repressor PhaR
MAEPPVASTAAAAETVQVVRYPNRRLYDRTQGRYVTLEEIAAMIRAGRVVSIRDSKTNDELTSSILMQIILEHHPERMELLPLPLLHMMIRTNGVMLGLLREYFQQSQAYLEFWQRTPAFNPLTASMDWMKSLMPGAPAAPPSAPADDGQALAERLAEMERRLNALEPVAGKKEQHRRRRSRR